jgi:hypothetical protein
MYIFPQLSRATPCGALKEDVNGAFPTEYPPVPFPAIVVTRYDGVDTVDKVRPVGESMTVLLAPDSEEVSPSPTVTAVTCIGPGGVIYPVTSTYLLLMSLRKISFTPFLYTLNLAFEIPDHDRMVPEIDTLVGGAVVVRVVDTLVDVAPLNDAVRV